MDSRGRVVEFVLTTKLTFNQSLYSRVLIEIDHINRGIDPKTRLLKTKERSSFTPNEIISFIFIFNEIDLVPVRREKYWSYYAVETFGPEDGPYKQREFRVIFATNRAEGLFRLITMYKIKKRKL